MYSRIGRPVIGSNKDCRSFSGCTDQTLRARTIQERWVA
jgi:hypothetical protein